jgi:hypothetical protein
VCVLPDFLSIVSFANELYANTLERTLQGALESYASSRFFWSCGSRLFLEKTARRAYYSRGLDRIEDSRAEKTCLVLGAGSDGERIGGPDHTMGGQGAKRTNDRDTDADTREAGAGNGDRYGKGPRPGKNTRW